MVFNDGDKKKFVGSSLSCPRTFLWGRRPCNLPKCHFSSAAQYTPSVSGLMAFSFKLSPKIRKYQYIIVFKKCFPPKFWGHYNTYPVMRSMLSCLSNRVLHSGICLSFCVQDLSVCSYYRVKMPRFT